MVDRNCCCGNLTMSRSMSRLSFSAESLAEWAKCSFGYGAALLKEHGSGLTVSLLATAASEASEAVDEAAANGLYAALCSLVAYTEEAKAPPPEEE